MLNSFFIVPLGLSAFAYRYNCFTSEIAIYKLWLNWIGEVKFLEKQLWMAIKDTSDGNSVNISTEFIRLFLFMRPHITFHAGVYRYTRTMGKTCNCVTNKKWERQLEEWTWIYFLLEPPTSPLFILHFDLSRKSDGYFEFSCLSIHL